MSVVLFRSPLEKLWEQELKVKFEIYTFWKDLKKQGGFVDVPWFVIPFRIRTNEKTFLIVLNSGVNEWERGGWGFSPGSETHFLNESISETFLSIQEKVKGIKNWGWHLLPTTVSARPGPKERLIWMRFLLLRLTASSFRITESRLSNQL